MKRLLVLSIFVALLLGFCFQNSLGQITDVKSLPGILQEIKKDSILQIERLAAIEFHKLINEYRAENGLNPLQWNETLWITSRNHNIWMETNDQLTHQQKANTKNFSGINPGDRYSYASGGKAEQSWSGENALYNFSAYGRKKEEVARNIANSSFKQWKNSPGHNANMLGKNHKIHGTAFYIGDDKVWGTDLFAACYTCPELTEIDKGNAILAQKTHSADENGGNLFATKEQENKATATVQNKTTEFKKPVKLNLQKSSASLIDQLYQSTYKTQKKNKSLEIAAQKQALYLLNAKTVSSSQSKNSGFFYAETPYKRVLKASGGMFIFAGGKKNLKENLLVLEMELDSFSEGYAISEIRTKLQKEIEGARMAGVSVQMKKRKNQLKIVAVGMSY